jgi:hypothetical protein
VQFNLFTKWSGLSPILNSDLQVDLSPNGKDMMRNYLYDICGLSGTFTIKDRQEKCLQEIIETVGDNKVLVRLINLNNRQTNLVSPSEYVPEKKFQVILDHGAMRQVLVDLLVSFISTDTVLNRLSRVVLSFINHKLNCFPNCFPSPLNINLNKSNFYRLVHCAYLLTAILTTTPIPCLANHSKV